MSDRRVVITGLGLVTPLGKNVKTSWQNLITGHSGVSVIKEFDASNLDCKIAAQIDRSSENCFNPLDYIEEKNIKKMDLFIQYGIAAAIEAITASNWFPQDEYLRDRTGVIIGSGIGGLKMIENTSIDFNRSFGNKRVSPFFIPASLINLVAGHIAIKYGFTGPNIALATACTTGTHSIGEAVRIIKSKDADVMIAGGTEAAITPVGIAGFCSAKALCTKYNDSPTLASRPWDQDRNGFVIGEGAGILVLEEYEHAAKRRAKMYGEIVGYGLTCHAYHITSNHLEGLGAYKSMSNALKNAKISASSIDYINAHGTSTLVGDIAELDAVQRLFYEANPDILMSSTKSSIGHLLGAAGSVEAIFSILALQDQIAPATLNLFNPINEAKIDLVPLKPKETKLNYVLSNSFGFGGTNASLVIKKI